MSCNFVFRWITPDRTVSTSLRLQAVSFFSKRAERKHDCELCMGIESRELQLFLMICINLIFQVARMQDFIASVAWRSSQSGRARKRAREQSDGGGRKGRND